MNSNLPYIMIYKGDFLRGNVSACSIAAQGLWFRLMLLMHDSERTGYLCINGLPILSRIAAVKCAVSVDEYEALFAELMSVSAFSTSNDGIIFSPQLVNEAEARAGNASRQRKHYDKKKKEKPNADLTTNLTPTSQDIPSSISSSSSTTFSKEKGGGGTRADADANGNGKPPPAAAESPPVEKVTKAKEARLDSLQTQYPQHDVRKVREKYLHWCRENRKDAKWEIFEEKWLKTEFEPMDGDDLVEAASPEHRRKAIENCSLCDANGYLKIGDGARICKHEKTGGKT